MLNNDFWKKDIEYSILETLLMQQTQEFIEYHRDPSNSENNPIILEWLTDTNRVNYGPSVIKKLWTFSP